MRRGDSSGAGCLHKWGHGGTGRLALWGCGGDAPWPGHPPGTRGAQDSPTWSRGLSLSRARPARWAVSVGGRDVQLEAESPVAPLGTCKMRAVFHVSLGRDQEETFLPRL